MVSASQHTWGSAGYPEHPYSGEACATVCATCAAPIDSGVPLAQIERPSTANHADYFRFGSKHVCQACAWLYAAGKGRPGNYIATCDRMECTVISLESVVPDKRPWIEVLRELASEPGHTPVAGVMTTDVKPRLWPRVRLATVERFGLYLHAPDYDVSEWRMFSLTACLDLIDQMIAPLTAGYTKASIYHGLLRDYARAARDPASTLAWETILATHRSQSHFLPALIAAGVTKENKHDVKSVTRASANPKPATAGCDKPDQAQLGLL